MKKISLTALIMMSLVLASCSGGGSSSSSPSLSQLESCGNGICEPQFGENVNNCWNPGIPLIDPAASGDCRPCTYELEGDATATGCCVDDDCYNMAGVRVCDYDGCCEPPLEDMGCDDCNPGATNISELYTTLMASCYNSSLEPVGIAVSNSKVYALNDRFVVYGYAMDWNLASKEEFGYIKQKSLLDGIVEEEIATLPDDDWHQLKVISMRDHRLYDILEYPTMQHNLVLTENLWLFNRSVLEILLGNINLPMQYDVKMGLCRITDWPSLAELGVDFAELLEDQNTDNAVAVTLGTLEFIKNNAANDQLYWCAFGVIPSISPAVLQSITSNANAIASVAGGALRIYHAYILFGSVMPFVADSYRSIYEDNSAYYYCVSTKGVRPGQCPNGVNNFCESNGYSSGIHCDGDEEVKCILDDGFGAEFSREGCPFGCADGTGCLEDTFCELNYCQAMELGSGNHCDGEEHVACGVDGDCFVELEREACADSCEEATGLCSGCIWGSGPCCTWSGTFRPSTYACDTSVTQYGCAGTECGDNALKRTGKRYCSGTASSCSGSYGSWSGWTLQENCVDTEKCVEGADEWDESTCAASSDCAAPIQCTSGPCCDGSYYKPNTDPCETLDSQFRCQNDGCGGDVQAKYQRRYCSGTSENCNGTIKWDTSWEDIYNCGSTQICDEDTWSCVNRECSGGSCCPDCRFLPDSHKCSDVTYYDCTSSGCGGDVERRTIKTYCPGNDNSCDGDVVDTGWYLLWDCDADEVCDDSGGSCETSSSCGSDCSPIIWSTGISWDVESYGVSLNWSDAPGADYYIVTRQVGIQSVCPGIGLALPGTPITSNAVDFSPLSGPATYGVYAIVDDGDCYEFSCGGRVWVTP